MPSFECPTCRKRFEVPRLEEASHRPFCSQRCKMVDLGRWLDGSYRVSEPITQPDGSAPDADGADRGRADA